VLLAISSSKKYNESEDIKFKQRRQKAETKNRNEEENDDHKNPILKLKTKKDFIFTVIFLRSE
jgi:hypothetical protein